MCYFEVKHNNYFAFQHTNKSSLRLQQKKTQTFFKIKAFRARHLKLSMRLIKHFENKQSGQKAFDFWDIFDFWDTFTLLSLVI